MTKIDFFKLQAKNLFKDFNTRVYDENEGEYIYYPRFFTDLEDILFDFDIDENSFTLMKAQHIIAKMAGFNKWTDLLHASQPILEIGRLLLEYRVKYEENQPIYSNVGLGLLVEDWKYYEKQYLQGVDDNSKLEVFNEVFINDIIGNAKKRNNPKITLDFTDAYQHQDMIVKLSREKNKEPKKAILSAINQKNCIRILETGWADMAVSHWGHADGYQSLEKLENPLIEISLNQSKIRLLSLIIEKEQTTLQNAIFYFIVFELENLGYHV